MKQKEGIELAKLQAWCLHSVLLTTKDAAAWPCCCRHGRGEWLQLQWHTEAPGNEPALWLLDSLGMQESCYHRSGGSQGFKGVRAGWSPPSLCWGEVPKAPLVLASHRRISFSQLSPVFVAHGSRWVSMDPYGSRRTGAKKEICRPSQQRTEENSWSPPFAAQCSGGHPIPLSCCTGK